MEYGIVWSKKQNTWSSFCCPEKCVVTIRNCCGRLLWESCWSAGIRDINSQVDHSALYLSVARTSTYHSVWTKWHWQNLPDSETCWLYCLFVSDHKLLHTVSSVYQSWRLPVNITNSKVSWQLELRHSVHYLMSYSWNFCLHVGCHKRWWIVGRMYNFVSDNNHEYECKTTCNLERCKFNLLRVHNMT